MTGHIDPGDPPAQDGRADVEPDEACDEFEPESSDGWYEGCVNCGLPEEDH